MPEAGDFGERAATEDEVDDWVDLVKAGRRATSGWRNRPNQYDSLRPTYGSGRASSEGDPE